MKGRRESEFKEWGGEMKGPGEKGGKTGGWNPQEREEKGRKRDVGNFILPLRSIGYAVAMCLMIYIVCFVDDECFEDRRSVVE